MKRGVVWILIAFGVATLFLPSIAQKSTKKPLEKGEQLFQQHCASCHAGGGNSVKSNRPVAGSKELSSFAKFKQYLTTPPGHMPYYQGIVKDHQTLSALYNYCKKLKAQTKQAYNGAEPITAELMQ
jgi:mono/diheme cytochrome c family protein